MNGQFSLISGGIDGIGPMLKLEQLKQRSSNFAHGIQTKLYLFPALQIFPAHKILLRDSLVSDAP